jgi:hypothetical protein
MTFDDLTADYIMTQKWYCGHKYRPGVYITYEDEDDGANVDCGILTPNPNFAYPDVYKELCRRICEEHNREIERGDNR